MISTDIVLHERYATNPTGEPFYRHAPGWILRDESGAFDADALPQTLLSLPSQAPRLTGRRWLSFRSRIGSFSR
jgi:hypothetical protein